MVEESSPLLPPAVEPIEAETVTALEPEPESGEPTPEPASEPGFICECAESMRSACEGLPSYKDQPYCVLHCPLNDKGADFKAALDTKLNNRDFDFRGVYFPYGVNFSGFEFSADVDFTSARLIRAADFTSVTFNANVYFISTTFVEAAHFNSAKFNGFAHFGFATFSSDADFKFATFCADSFFGLTAFSAVVRFNSATFCAGADFLAATFSADADFSSVTFSAAADFKNVTFSAGAHFRYALFAHVDFNSATFSDADFDHSVFNGAANFRRASFKGSIEFFGSATAGLLKNGSTLAPRALGKDTSLDFQHARIERPERVAFHTLALRPHWFVNLDCRRLVFTDARWKWNRIEIRQEIEALERKGVAEPHRLLVITCRQLAENAEANNRYEGASRFRYWAMDLARRSKWRGWAFWRTDWLHMLYWAVSGYGERILRALGVLGAVWFVFVLLYTQVGFVQQPPQPSNTRASSVVVVSDIFEDSVGQPLEVRRALTYSLAVMSLQKPDPKPLTGTAHTLVTLETILGPVQAALFALAIRRKFMR